MPPSLIPAISKTLPLLFERSPTPTDSDTASTSTSCAPNDNSARCQTPVKDNTGIAVGLGVGVPVFIAICVLLYLQLRHKRQLRKEDEGSKELDVENDDDFGTAVPPPMMMMMSNNNNAGGGYEKNQTNYSVQQLHSKPSEQTLIDSSSSNNQYALPKNNNQDFATDPRLAMTTPKPQVYDSANPFATPNSLYQIPHLQSSQRSLNNYDPYDKSAYPPSGDIYNTLSNTSYPPSLATRPSSPTNNNYNNPYGQSFNAINASSQYTLLRQQPSNQTLKANGPQQRSLTDTTTTSSTSTKQPISTVSAAHQYSTQTAPQASSQAASTVSLPQTQQSSHSLATMRETPDNNSQPSSFSNLESRQQQQQQQQQQELSHNKNNLSIMSTSQYSGDDEDDDTTTTLSFHNPSNSLNTPSTGASLAGDESTQHSPSYGENAQAKGDARESVNNRDFDRVKSVYKEYFPTGMHSPEISATNTDSGFDFASIPESPLDQQQQQNSANVQYQYSEQAPVANSSSPSIAEHQPAYKKAAKNLPAINTTLGSPYQQPQSQSQSESQSQPQPQPQLQPQPQFHSQPHSQQQQQFDQMELYNLPMPHDPAAIRSMSSTPTGNIIPSSPSQASFRSARSGAHTPVTHVPRVELSAFPVPHNLSETDSPIAYAPIRKNYALAHSASSTDLAELTNGTRSNSFSSGTNVPQSPVSAASPIIPVYNPLHNNLNYPEAESSNMVLPSPHQLRKSIALMTSLEFRPPNKYANEERNINTMTPEEREVRRREDGSVVAINAGRFRPPSALVPDDKTQKEKLRPTMEMR
ncbi:uncharacterized protein SAPINGB_P005410 [Magnusiomyces paraingens]|uniref:Uncharacterized protein n=1 Tax=Magnusiomyces paraingens TaxID=2606893 RepID=A0A5E8BZP5_9ASCO|nr:uncharacterized protein SAPINGB_P005410 [Saprochaete ingens]VVT56923.1 unnamed protein product [Saprochaete ingens]